MKQPMTPYCGHLYQNERGWALVLVLVLVGVLTVVGTTAVTLTSTDLLVGGNYKASQQAFYGAEAGVQYTLGRIPTALSTGALSLKGTTVSEDYTVTAPGGFSFELSPTATFKRVANTRKYYFQVTGRPNPNSSISSTIEVVIRRATFLPYGLFGDDLINLDGNGSIYSYNSNITPNPTPTDSTGEGDIGSNGVIQGYPSTSIDGDVELGDDGAGTEAVFTDVLPGLGTTTITGQIRDVDRVAPDPLGVVGGNLATDIANASIVNDNALAGITANTLNLGNGDTLTLTAGTYYLQSITLDAGSTLNIDSSLGEVIIYLVGGLEARVNSTITFTGPPPGFSIYSNASDPVSFKYKGDFKGTCYAPYAGVETKNTGSVYGLIWGKTVDMAVDHAGKFYFDTALKDKFLSNRISIVSWKEIHD